MVNFIALSVSAWMIFELIPAKMVQRTISIGKEFRIKDPVSIYLNPVFIVGILCCVLLYFIMTRTKYGFQTKAMGSNIYASKLSGINPSIITVITFFLCRRLCSTSRDTHNFSSRLFTLIKFLIKLRLSWNWCCPGCTIKPISRYSNCFYFCNVKCWFK